MAGFEIGGRGMGAAVESVVDTQELPPNVLHGEQMPLLPLADPSKGTGQNAGGVDTQRGVGRPAGSKNKITKAWQDYLLGQYTSPLEVLASTMTRSVQDLAQALGYIKYAADGVTMIRNPSPDELRECLKIQLSCAKELAPYLHQKQPQAVELDNGGLMTLNIFSAPVADVKNAENFGFQVLDLEIEENQGLSDDEKQKTNACATNGDSEAVENIE